MKNMNDFVPCPILKSCFDKFLVMVMLLVLAPIWILIFVLSKLNGLFCPSDRGPIFYRIERVSHGETFWLIKFRTVKMASIDQLLAKHGRIDDIKSLERESVNLTWLGNFLKKFYLDELPQFSNILKGELSFVGPRPYPLDAYRKELEQGITRKKVARAGLTGLVQIDKSKCKSFAEEVGLDEQYIRKVRTASWLGLFFFDLKILLRSLFVLAKGEGL